MKCFIRKLAYIVILIISFFSLGMSVVAEKLNFPVSPITSNSQRHDIKSYFDLRVKPGNKEILQIELENHSDKDMIILANANAVVTNDNITADYSQHDPEINHTLKYSFSDMAQVKPEIPLKAREKRVIDIPVDVPSEPFNDIILGGLEFQQKPTEDMDLDTSSLLIENNFAFVIGVRFSENDDKVPVKIDLLNVRARQRNYRNTVLVTFENPEPRILPDVEIESSIYSEKDVEEALYYDKIEHADIAPNSSFDYGISLNNDTYKPGKYVLKTMV